MALYSVRRNCAWRFVKTENGALITCGRNRFKILPTDDQFITRMTDMCLQENQKAAYRNALKIIHEDNDVIEGEQHGDAPRLLFRTLC